MTLRCEACGNDYDKPMQVVLSGVTHTFDCFECAIHVLAPACARCGLKVVGHGVEAGGAIYCSAHCARSRGFAEARDRL